MRVAGLINGTGSQRGIAQAMQTVSGSWNRAQHAQEWFTSRPPIEQLICLYWVGQIQEMLLQWMRVRRRTTIRIVNGRWKRVPHGQGFITSERPINQLTCMHLVALLQEVRSRCIRAIKGTTTQIANGTFLMV